MSYETTGRLANRLSKKSILPWPIYISDEKSDSEDIIWDDKDLVGSDCVELDILLAYKDLNKALKNLPVFDASICVDDIVVEIIKNKKNKDLYIIGFQLAVEERYRRKGPSVIHKINFICKDFSKNPIWTYESDSYKHGGRYWYLKEFKSAQQMIEYINDNDSGQIYTKRVIVKRKWANDTDL